MSRKQPENSEHGRLLPPEVTKQSGLPERTMKIGAVETKITVQTRQYKLITPLFGGGVEPGVNDLDNMIRGTEIRGQLRFWWRAIRGGQFGGDLAAMKKREDEIWGAASATKGQKEQNEKVVQERLKQRKWIASVQIEVEIRQKGQPIKPFVPVPRKGKYKAESVNGFPDYAAFPLRPDEEKLKLMGNDTPIADLRQDVEFDLKIIFPDKWTNEVQATLWAWETFGGIGARTRRGFGVLQRVSKEQSDLPPANQYEAEKWLREKINFWCTKEIFPDDVPHLGSKMYICVAGKANTPLMAWNHSIGKLRKFRQIPEGRDGRSKWPEAEAIRQLTGYRFTHLVRGQYIQLPSLNHPQKFPRAVFGLPIVFHFKNEDKKKPPSQRFDPPEMTLQGSIENQERWASPLILRPLICQNGQALSFACILQGTELPKQMQLKANDEVIQPHDIARSQTHLEAKETAGIPVLHGQTDVLLAFLKYFGL